jgi:molybdopterin synthase sulfur carrier subunit
VANVWIPTTIRELTNGQQQVRVDGNTIREIIDNLDFLFPGIKNKLCNNGQMLPGIAIIVDGVSGGMGMLEQVMENSEVHFLPAIGGGMT